ncbi:MAG: hypothetical protein AAF416_22955 [Pseudomonadota bacterium]
MTEAPLWPAIWKINGNCLRAAMGFGFGWVFLEWSTAPGFELAALFAGLFALGGALCAVRAVIGTIKLILRQRRWARYGAQGAAPKADRLAREADLRAKGLIR